ncbi:hypothetical protein ACLOJK_018179 [Asimina triloba]
MFLYPPSPSHKITMGPKKVTRVSSSSDAKQLAQLLKHKGEGPIEDLLEDFPLHPKSSTLSSLVLAPPDPIPTGLDPNGVVIGVEFSTLLEIIKSLLQQFSHSQSSAAPQSSVLPLMTITSTILVISILVD